MLLIQKVKVSQRFMENFSGGNYLNASVEKKILRVDSGLIVLFQKDDINGPSAYAASITMFLGVSLHLQAS